MPQTIRAKLLAMMLAVGFTTAGLVGYLGISSASSALTKSADQRVSQMLESRKGEITAFYKDAQSSLAVFGSGSTANDAVDSFILGFQELQASSVSYADLERLRDTYQTDFIDQLANQPADTSLEKLLPRDPAQLYLQSHYTNADLDYDKSIEVHDAGDGSSWSASHARYHSYFQTMVRRFAYEDVLLLAPDGTVVYSAYKGPDLGTNLLTGPYRQQGLSDAIRSAEYSNMLGRVEITDFAPYIPSLNAPTQWLVSPIVENGVTHGTLAAQMPVSRVDEIMTSDRHWNAEGFGRTGETYLVGSDDLMRSNSRLFLENPSAYNRRSADAGTPASAIQLASSSGTTIQAQPAGSEVVRLARSGDTGVRTVRSYLGVSTITAYTPLPIAGLRWVLIAEIDESEALEAIPKHAWSVSITLGIVAAAILALSFLWARTFTAPVRQFSGLMKRVRAEDYESSSVYDARDDFGELGLALSSMTRTLGIRRDLVEAQERERMELLRHLMPPSLAARHNRAVGELFEVHPSATLVLAMIYAPPGVQDGPDELAAVNALFQEFDRRAARFEMTSIRSRRLLYLAASFSSPNASESALHSLDYAVEMLNVMDEANSLNDGADFNIRICIASGPITGGVIEGAHLAYDVWGSPVEAVKKMHAAAEGYGILVSESIVTHGGARKYLESGVITVGGSPFPVWKLIPPHSAPRERRSGGDSYARD